MTQLEKTAGVDVQDLPFVGKFSLRCRPDGRSAVSSALGLELPSKIGEMSRTGTRQALCLGPDEWMVHCPEDERAAISEASADLGDTTPHSLVDVSFREVGIEISGPNSEVLLNTSCPRDLTVIAPGQGTRTIFDSAQVVLIREAKDRFHMFVWRSFYPHVRDLLATGERELALGL